MSKRTTQKQYNTTLINLLNQLTLPLPNDKISVKCDLYNILESGDKYPLVPIELFEQNKIYEKIKLIKHQLKHRTYKNVNDFIVKIIKE